MPSVSREDFYGFLDTLRYDMEKVKKQVELFDGQMMELEDLGLDQLVEDEEGGVNFADTLMYAFLQELVGSFGQLKEQGRMLQESIKWAKEQGDKSR